MTQEHRKPPKPPHYDNPDPGQCKWCGNTILKADGSVNKRSHWHPYCVKEYKLIHWPKVTRMAVYKRDKAKCACCGIHCGKGVWHMDHIKPLYQANGDIDYWRLGNLQTLCTECHKDKTILEAKDRAQLRKKAKEEKVSESPTPPQRRTKKQK